MIDVRPVVIPNAPALGLRRGVGELSTTYSWDEMPMGVRVIYGLVGTASMALSAYHGYRRNNSVGWAIWWGFMGGLFPIITPVIAVAQGFGKRA